MTYLFKGKIENSIFTGPGMLKFKLDESQIDDGNWVYDKTVCFTIPRLLPEEKSPESLTGNWINGNLEGNLKVNYKHATFISQVSKGDMHGITR